MSKEPMDIKSILFEALEKKDAKDRVAYLDRVCGNDAGLRAEVESLLKSHEQAGDFLPSPDLDPEITLNDTPLTEGPGTVIGRYKLLEQIGEGGFGVVYMADQTKPISRRVALKIIKLGMDTKSVIARFEAERQALAMMEHPNIAKVLDAGATDTGRPYFVMELVKGIPITEYCDKNNLDTQQRLELFISVCKAIQHAHQKGIIHRDLKPSNVMITLHDGRPVPKVIDFGVAKATAQRLTEKTLFTRFAQMIGTPEYMSPEQAEFSGLDVDARSDIYSLGVLLYQLLTGATPFDAEKLRQAGYSEMQRIIREEEPDKPSTRLSVMGETLTEIARHRKVSPDLLQKLVRGDLDWIVMKTLEKDRTRRYERAIELAADIQRHLNNEPVQAVAPSVSYRLRKFVRRNRVAVITCSLITVALAVGATIATLTLLGSGRLAGGIDESEFARAVRERLEQLDGGAPGQEEAKLVWTYPNLRYVATPSPDGHHLVFLDQDTGDLAIRDLQTGTNRRLTHNNALFKWRTTCARFSPDGKWIAYDWFGNEDDKDKADLRIIGIDGSGSRIVCQPDGNVRSISPRAWFPDGKRILAWSYLSDETRQIVIVSVADGSTKVLKSVQSHETDDLSLSPDGRYVAFDFRQHGTSGPDDISLLPVDGGPEIPIIEHPADDDVLAWSPDGRMLVFRSDRRGQGDDAWVIQIIDGKPQGRPQRLKHLGPSDTIGNSFFTKDGSLYYTMYDADAKPQWQSNVCMATLDPETGKVLDAPTRVSQRSGGTAGTEWSPDGEYLAYTTQFNTTTYPLLPRLMVIHSIETGRQREIPLEAEFWSFHGYSIRWSPDGQSILVDCFDPPEESGSANVSWQWRSGLLRLNVASGKVTPIVPISDGQRWPAGWSADGKKIFYGCAYWNQSTRKYTSSQIVVRNLETGRERELYRVENTSLAHIALSPDGRQLAFPSSLTRSEALMVMPAEGGKPRELCRVQEGDIDPGVVAWTPDGRYLIFGKRSQDRIRGVVTELWRIPAGGGEPQKLELAARFGAFEALRVHPDGKQVAFANWSLRWPDQELRVIDNFLPDLASPPVQLPSAAKGNYSVTRSEDDAEERADGSMISLDDGDLDLGEDERVVGIRFADIHIPKGAWIKKAYLQFTSESSDDVLKRTDLMIHAELSANAGSFTEAKHNISSRKRIRASVKWSPVHWNMIGERSEKQRTPDLSSLIQEVITQPDWREGNALVLIITGSGDRDAFSFDSGGRRYAPMLHIEY